MRKQLHEGGEFHEAIYTGPDKRNWVYFDEVEDNFVLVVASDDPEEYFDLETEELKPEHMWCYGSVYRDLKHLMKNAKYWG